MTKIVALTGLLLLTATSAFAGCGDDGTLNGNDCLLLSSTLTTMAPLIAPTASSSEQSRLEYVGNVREDAAEFVAADGKAPADAMLANAMTQIRAKAPEAAQMSDLNLAKLIEADFN